MTTIHEIVQVGVGMPDLEGLRILPVTCSDFLSQDRRTER